MRLVSHVPLVRADLGRAGAEWFVVDTGAAVTVVTPRVASRLNEGPVTVGPDQGGGTERRPLRVPKMTIGTVSFLDVAAVELDLGAVEAAMGVQLGGIIGVGLFRDFTVTFDYPGGKFLIDGRQLPPSNGQDILHYALEEDAIMLPLVVGESKIRAWLDTGAGGEHCLTAPRGASVGPYTADPVVAGRLATAGSTRQRYAARLDRDALLGVYRIQKPTVAVTDEGRVTIGGGLLSRFVVSIDQKRQIVRLSRAAHEPIVFGPIRTTGVSLQKEATGWRVTGVLGLGETPTDVVPGDIVEEANGSLTDAFTIDDWNRLKDSSSAIRVVGTRAGERFSASIPVVTLVD